MKLSENPFFVLGASTRDDRRRLLALSEEFALAHDSQVGARARADLTNPRQRLKAEVRWLPGLSPARARALVERAALDLANEAPHGVLSPLAAVNLLTWRLIALAEQGSGGCSTDDIMPYVLEIALLADRVDAGDVLLRLNEDRTVAGLPQVDRIDDIEAELQEWYGDLHRAVTGVLRALPLEQRLAVLRSVLATGTKDGAEHGPSLLHGVTDALALDFHDELEIRTAAVAKEVEVLRRMVAAGLPEDAVLRQLHWLDLSLKAWDEVAQPLQLSAQARGQEHEHSRELAYEVRNLAIELHNSREFTRAAERITVLVREVFAELTQLAARVDEDLQVITGLLEAQHKEESDRLEWEASIHFEGTIGLLFKEQIGVSAQGVRHSQTVIPLHEVARVRWGGTRHSINGIPVGTTYTVVVSGKSSSIQFECRNVRTFEQFISALRRAVVSRLAVELAQRLRAGEQVLCGPATIDDSGVWLVKSRLFRPDEVSYWAWSQVSILSHGGMFIIRATPDPGFCVMLSYLKDDNTHVLEALIRLLWNRGGARLSDVFADDE